MAEPATHSHGQSLTVSTATTKPESIASQLCTGSSGRFRDWITSSYSHCPRGYVPAWKRSSAKAPSAVKAKVPLKKGPYNVHCQTSAQQQQMM